MPMPRHASALVFLSAVAATLSCGRSPEPRAPSEASYAPKTADDVGGERLAAPPPAPASTAPAQPSHPAPVQQPGFAEPPPSDLAGLTAQLERDEQALLLALSHHAAPEAKAGAAPRDEARPAPTAAPAAPPPGADGCVTACAALASMKRAADRMCDLVGARDAVCGGARERVQRAEQRVTASCSDCRSD